MTVTTAMVQVSERSGAAPHVFDHKIGSVSSTVAPPRTRYRATDNGDGTFEIHDVPIFGPLPEGVIAANPNPTVGRPWMEKAVLRAQQRLAEGYKAPAHIRHTTDTSPPERIGFVIPRRVGELTYEGKKIPAIFADLSRVPALYVERFQRGELPYRSVEVADWNDPEIRALAILQEKVPFFRFPVIEGLDVVSAAEVAANVARFDAGPVVACFSHAAGRSVLARFADEDVPAKDDEKPEPAKQDDAAALDESAEGEPTLADVMTGLKAVASAMTELVKHLKGEEDEKMPTPVDDAKAKEGPEGEKKPAELAADTGTLATLQAENAGLKGRLAALEADAAARASKERIDGIVGGALAQLAAYNPPPSAKETLALLAAPTNGQALVDAYVRDFKAGARRDPPRSFADAFGPDASDVEPQEVAKFAAQGATQLEKARGFHREWIEIRRRMPGFDVPLAEHIRLGFERTTAGASA